MSPGGLTRGGIVSVGTFGTVPLVTGRNGDGPMRGHIPPVGPKVVVGPKTRVSATEADPCKATGGP
jgi:hypothetical protein